MIIIYAGSNKLTFTIPSQLADIATLEYLDICKFTPPEPGTTGSFPNAATAPFTPPKPATTGSFPNASTAPFNPEANKSEDTSKENGNLENLMKIDFGKEETVAENFKFLTK